MYGNTASDPRRDNYSSSRPSRGGGYNRGGRGGRGGYRGGGRGGPAGRGGGRGWANSGGSNYNRHARDAAGNGFVATGNRFQDRPQLVVDPQQQVLQDLLHMVTQVGALTVYGGTPSSSNNGNDATTADDSQNRVELSSSPQLKQHAQNVQLLTGVVCGSNAHLFLKYDLAKVSAMEHYGPMVVHLQHCAVSFPLQTAVYTALALGLHENVAVTIPSDATTSFLARLLEYSGKLFSRDLDVIFLSLSTSKATVEERAQAFTRCRLQLRYWALLEQVGGVFFTKDISSADASILSLRSLLVRLVQASQYAVQQSRPHIAWGLASLVLSTMFHLIDDGNEEWIETQLLTPLDDLVQKVYVSAFAPGVGSHAILLKDDQVEESEEDEDEDDDDEEVDEDEEEEATSQVCDTLQDLLRSVKFHFQKKSISRLSLLTERQPWTLLTAPVGGENKADSSMIEDDAAVETADASSTKPLKYTGEPLSLTLASSKALKALLSLGSSSGTSDDAEMQQQQQELNNCPFLGVAIFARLPLFGPPPDLEMDEDDEPDASDDAATAEGANDRLRMYQTGFGLVDRYLIGELVRDVLFCLEPVVSETGVEIGSVKTVAEHIWSLRCVIRNQKEGQDEKDPAKGLEYAILETILSLVVQCNCTTRIASLPSTSSPFSLVYLARVLLELVKLEPALFSPAVVLGVSTLVQDYMPALTPTARANLGQWLAWHLIHTDYQWPAGYWKIWEPLCCSDTKNSRGAFVQEVLTAMAENLSHPKWLVKDCLPKDSRLVDQLLPVRQHQEQEYAASELQRELQQRMANKEDPDVLMQYILSTTAASTSDSQDGGIPINPIKWGKTVALMRAILAPAEAEYGHLKSDLDQARTSTDEMDDDDDDDCSGGGAFKDDVLTLVLDSLQQYKPVILGVLESETRSYPAAGAGDGAVLLRELDRALFYSRPLRTTCVQAFMKDGLASLETILQWLLGDDMSSEDENRAANFQATSVIVSSQWWELAISCIHQGMIQCKASCETKGGFEMEGVESSISATNGGDAAAAKGAKEIQTLLQLLDRLLPYVVTRSRAVLAGLHDVTKGNKLLPGQVEIVEGCKMVVTCTEAMYYSVLLQGETASSAALLHKAWIESTVAGPRLASLLDGGEVVPAVEMLRKSLERM